MPPTASDALFCGDAADGAAHALFALMSGLSQEHWGTGWMSGIEIALWHIRANQPFGQGTITARQAMLIQLLHEECDGWWVWHDGAKFVSTAEWLKIWRRIP